MDIELNHLRSFYFVCEAGSFTAAAKLLRTSQPSLSKAVQILEARTGQKLFERSKKGIQPTKLGKKVYQECQEIFGRIRQIENHCLSVAEEISGPLRIAASDHIAGYILVSPLIKIKEKHQLLTPKLFVGSPLLLIENLEKRNSEFALCFTTVASKLVEYSPMCELPLALVDVPSSSKEKAFDFSQENDYPVIGSIMEDYKINPTTKFLSKRRKTSPPLSLESNSQEIQKRLCLAGAGPVLLMKFMVERELASGELIEKLPKKNKSPQLATLYMMKRKDHDLTPAANEFFQILCNSLKRHSEN